MSVYKNLYFWEDFILEYLFNLKKLLIKNVGGIVIYHNWPLQPLCQDYGLASPAMQ